MIEPLVVGQVYRRRDLHARFGGQQQGGISTPAKHPVILLFTGEQGKQYGYADGFHADGVFWYTGDGQVGDMELTRRNLAIAMHARDGKELLLFEYVATGQVKFLGSATYLAHHTEVAPDRNRNPRNTLVFELLVDAPRGGVPELTPDIQPPTPASLLKRTLKQLRDEALGVVPSDHVLSRRSVAYYRSAVVKAYVLRRASGKCEGCGTPAPFMTVRNEPYLEPHHIRRRADDGPDHPQWVIALCPNCHKRVHYGVDGREYNIELAHRVADIEHEFSQVA